MARRKYTWMYNGIKVTKRWLEFNYGTVLVADWVSQADRFFRVNPNGTLFLGNGVSCIK